jgi:hypothetical protein
MIEMKKMVLKQYEKNKEIIKIKINQSSDNYQKKANNH